VRRRYELGNERIDVGVSRAGAEGDGVRLDFGNRKIEARLEPLGNGAFHLVCDGTSHRIWMAARGDRIFVHMGGASYEIRRIEEAEGAGIVGHGHDVAMAPMPGTVVAVLVQPGQSVKPGQTLMRIESMKLETAITAWRAGRVKAVHVAQGAALALKAPLLSLEPES
jgi:acetyl/propionyl-CoA carboxylase alpha subunit